MNTELVHRLAASLGVSEGEARRAIGEVLAFHSETVEALVRRRHAECQRQGMRNPAIFALLAQEVRGRVVAGPELTERQVRRLIYG